MSALMRLGIVFGIACSLLLVQHVSAAAEDDVLLESSGPWRLDMNERRCRLVRTFGEDDDRHILYFEQYAPARSFVINAAGPEFNRFRQARRVDIALGQHVGKDIGRVGEYGEFGRAIYSTRMRTPHKAGSDPSTTPLQIDTSLLEDVDYVRFVWGRRTLRLETRNLRAPLEALNLCSENLLAEYGLDIEQQRARASEPEIENRDEIYGRIKSDFPREAIRQGNTADVRLFAVVDTEGRVAQCRVINMLEFPEVREKVCETMQDARFAPARNAEGQAMRSFYTATIVYRLES